MTQQHKVSKSKNGQAVAFVLTVSCMLTTHTHSVSVLRTESEKSSEKKLGKKKKPKKKERLEEEAEEEGGEEVEGGWEKVKGGAPMVKVKKRL